MFLPLTSMIMTSFPCSDLFSSGLGWDDGGLEAHSLLFRLSSSLVH